MQLFEDSPPFWAIGNEEALLKAILDGQSLKEDLPEPPSDYVA